MVLFIRMCFSQAEIIWTVAIVSFAAISLTVVLVLYTMIIARQRRLHERVLFESEIGWREDMRRYFARELHDNVGQLFALAMLKADELATEDVIPAREELVGLAELTDRAYRELRDVSHLNDGVWVMRNGLDKSIAEAADLHGRNTGCPVTLSLPVDGMPELDPAATLVLFRAVQEALTNIAKHAQATHADITIQEKDERLEITITDDGIGFAGVPPGSTGLYNLRKRIEHLQGRTSITSVLGKGTTLTLSLPHPNRKIQSHGNDSHSRNHRGHPG